MKKIVALALLLFPYCLWASDFDFGLALNQELGFSGYGDETETDYSAAIVPYLSAPLGASGGLYISAALTARYELEEWFFVPELLHTELSLNFNRMKLSLGRIPYAAPLDFIVEGFFDGMHILFDTSAGTFNAGAWYTGLLYKKSANITMTLDDLISYYTPFDYDDFPNTYFASKRVLWAFGWEHPSVGDLIRLNAAVTGEVDLNDTAAPFNSVYVSAKAAVPLKSLIFMAGMGVQMAKYADGTGTDKTGTGFAGELGALLAMSGAFPGQLSLIWRYSGGNSDKSDSIKAFVPVTTNAQGDILQAKLSGLMAFFLDYTAQFSPKFAASLTNSYFARTDYGTYSYYPVYAAGKDGGYYLGTELFGRFMWSPLSDLNLSLGGGCFFPNSAIDEGSKWRVELGIVFVLY